MTDQPSLTSLGEAQNRVDQSKNSKWDKSRKSQTIWKGAPCTEQVQLTRYKKDNVATPVLPHGHSVQHLQTFLLSNIALGCVKHWWMNSPRWASCSQSHLQGMVSDSRPAFGHTQPHLQTSTTCKHLPRHLQQLRWWRYDCCTPQGLHATTWGKNDREPIKYTFPKDPLTQLSAAGSRGSVLRKQHS